MNAAKLILNDHSIDEPLPAAAGHSDKFPTPMRLGRKIMMLCTAALLLAASAQAQVASKTTVIFEPDVTAAEIDSFVADWAPLGVFEVMGLPFINGMVLSLPAEISAADLATDPVVQSAVTDHQGELQAVRAAGEGGAQRFIEFAEHLNAGEAPWGMLHLYGLFFDPALYAYSYRGTDVPRSIRIARIYARDLKIAVFDTGVNSQHTLINNRIAGGVDLVDFTPGIPTDDNGHGTHVAGTIVGLRHGLSYHSELYVLKILDSEAMGDSSTIVMALQWSLDNDIDVANMSVGFRDDNPAVRLAVQKAHEAGLIMVAAAGNHSNWEDNGGAGEGGAGEGGAGEGGAGEGGAGEGGAGEGGAGEGGAGDSCDGMSGAGEGGAGEGGAGEGGAGEGGAGEGGAGEGGASTDCTSTDPYAVMYPAAYPEVIAVGAIDPYGDMATFSNDGPEIDVLAPGVDIFSSDIGDNFNGIYEFGLANGTSMAAPHVTGAVALMLGYADYKRKTLSVTEVEQIIKDTAANGIINLEAALQVVDAL